MSLEKGAPIGKTEVFYFNVQWINRIRFAILISFNKATYQQRLKHDKALGNKTDKNRDKVLLQRTYVGTYQMT